MIVFFTEEQINSRYGGKKQSQKLKDKQNSHGYHTSSMSKLKKGNARLLWNSSSRSMDGKTKVIAGNKRESRSKPRYM